MVLWNIPGQFFNQVQGEDSGITGAAGTKEEGFPGIIRRLFTEKGLDEDFILQRYRKLVC